MKDYTPHQQKIIQRYYDNRDEIMVSKLSELVTDLYLTEDSKKLDRLWERAGTAMQKLKWPAKLVEQLLAKRSPEALAAALKERMGRPG